MYSSSHTEARVLLDEKQLAVYTRLSRRTLQKLRYTGGGPPFIKLGSSVRYDKADVDAWLDSRRVSSTSDASQRGL